MSVAVGELNLARETIRGETWEEGIPIIGTLKVKLKTRMNGEYMHLTSSL
jgi:hypothetical protein